MRFRILLLAWLVVHAGTAAQETRPDSRPRTNRLGAEKSPYLRLHAGNPVAWYPWGDEAFAAAVRENKPVFFSSGYASCHWCHVMARESFENAAIAAFLNEHFICVKLDREERPDVDRVYLEACALLTGSGGWPLNAFLTPGRRPFYLATYLPPDDRGEEPGFLSVSRAVAKLWRDRSADLDTASLSFAEGFALRHLPTSEVEALIKSLERRAFAAVIASTSRPASSSPTESPAEADARLSAEEEADAWRVRVVRAREELERRGAASRPVSALDLSADRYRELEDSEVGGFGLGPKFPATSNLAALLRSGVRNGTTAERVVVERQLQAMMKGAIRDRIGGGWHRYAVDRHWLVPHYEKMLYDQALNAQALLEAWQLAGDPAFERALRETLAFVQKELRSESGGYIAALDAESPAGEGAYYLWTRTELKAALSPDVYPVLATWAGLEGDGVADDESSTIGERTPLDDVAAILKIGLDTARTKLAAGFVALADHRRLKRPPPRRIETVISGWNALFVSALARAGGALQDEVLTTEAARLMNVLDAKLRGADGLYRRRMIDGEVAHAGELSDQSYALLALLDLHEATLDPARLVEAGKLAARIVEAYGAADGGLFDSIAPDLPWRTRETTDDAWPGGMGAALLGFVRLAFMTEDPVDRARADRLAGFLRPRAADSAADHATAAVALDLWDRGAARVVLHGDLAISKILAAEVRGRFRPFVVITRSTVAPTEERPYAVVCVREKCFEPAFDAAMLIKRLDEALR